MGQGRFKDGKFDLVVGANFSMTPADWTAWERTFRKASELFYNASEGQIRFGKLFACDDSIGLDTAEIILHPDGDPSYGTFGKFGQPGEALHLMPYVTTRGPLTILHEMGHHVWGLHEEYSAPLENDQIDKSSDAPDNSTIPIIDSSRSDNELVGKDAILTFGDLIERREITANTSTSIVVDSAFPDLPTNSDSDWVWYQSEAECSNVANSNYCIMENSRAAAGYFNAAGVWVPAANPVTEFCTASNHDPDDDTAQEDLHGKSCWEVIVERDEFSDLDVPDPASGEEPGGYLDPEWIKLDKQSRFALVLDRSGSMSSGHKMADAQHGAIYWLEFCAESDDMLSIIWYDHIIDEIIGLAEISTLGDLTAEKDAINALSPRGSTNIRDGLYGALNQIQSLPTRSAVEATLLLTDGKHNTPYGSSAVEVLPDYQEGGVRIYSLGVGTPDLVDMDILDELSLETGGRSYAVGDDNPGDVEAAMVEINAEVRGGIITTIPALFPDSRSSRLDDVIAKYLKLGKRAKRPKLEELLKALRLKNIEGLFKLNKKNNSRIHLIPVQVEDSADRVSFSLIYPAPNAVWLYLLDPDNQPYYGPNLKHVISDSPHEFAIVENPKPGRWHIVAVRTEPGPHFKLHAVAGIENRDIQVFGGASSRNCKEAPVRIWASARWKHQLSGLLVTATINGPDRRSYSIKLNDDLIDEPFSGQYEGFFCPKKNGRYHGVIRVQNFGHVVLSNPIRHILHSSKGKVDLPVKVPPFVREIPFYFDSGERPKIDADHKEQPLKYQRMLDRKVELKSAK